MVTKWTNQVTLSRARKSDAEGNQMLSSWAHTSPRRGVKIELMYIRHNTQRAKEVRLMARYHVLALALVDDAYKQRSSRGVDREQVSREPQADPHTLNETLAALSPRNAVSKDRRRPSRLVALGTGADWEVGLKQDGSRLEGEGVRWCGNDSPLKIFPHASLQSGRISPVKTTFFGSGSSRRSPILKRQWSAGRGPAKKRIREKFPNASFDDEANGEALSAKRGAVIEPLRLPIASPAKQSVTFSPAGHAMDELGSPRGGRKQSMIEPLNLQTSAAISPQRSPKRLSIYNPGDITQRSRIKHVQWPRSEDEFSVWFVLAQKLNRRARKGAGTVAFAAAAETAFSGYGEQLKKATSLEVVGQHLMKIPRQWLNEHLLRISLKECDLSHLPPTIGNRVPGLEQLFVDHNRLTALPDSLGLMENLRDLGLTANLFTQFPEVIGKLTSLQILSVQNNKLEAIPPCVGYCKSMKAMYLTKNPLTSISLAVGMLADLRCLTLDVTDELRQPPPVVARMGFDFLHEYLSLHMHNATVLFRHELRKSFLKCKQAFLQFDVDGDGELDQEEVRAALEVLKTNMDYFDDLWVVLDVDNSGSVTYDEFFDNMMKTQHATLRDPREELTAVTDANEEDFKSAFRMLNSLSKPTLPTRPAPVIVSSARHKRKTPLESIPQRGTPGLRSLH